MYYNSNKNNNDYYNSYKQELQELEAYNKQEVFQKIIKLALTVLTTILFVLGSFFLYKYFYPTLEKSTVITNKSISESKKELPELVITESELPQSIQLSELEKETQDKIQSNATDSAKQIQLTTGTQTTNMSAQDIALIVQIIMSQMNTKAEMPLEEQLAAVEKKKYEAHSLKESNHYNKVILTSNETNKIQNSALMELTNNINNVLEEQTGENPASDYSTAIKKEVVFRTNEMRIIIVQRGDTLSRIAKKAYGNSDAYPKIFSANPEIIKNPDQIFVGQRLRIPS